MDEVYLVFTQEAREQLAALEEGLLRLEQGERDSDTLHAIFRAAHTLKGAAGVMELRQIEQFTHQLENILDKLRNQELTVSDELVSAMLKGCDYLSALVDRVEQGKLEPDSDLVAQGEALAQRLHDLAASPAPTSPADEDQTVAKVERVGGDTAVTDCWHISIRFGRDVLRHGIEPLAFLRYLSNLGEIVHLTTLLDALPPADEMDPESCYLGFEIWLYGNTTKEAIENVFLFCRDECDLFILPPHSKINDYLELIENLPEEPRRIGEILVAAGAITQRELEEALRRQKSAKPDEKPQVGHILVEQKAVEPDVVEAAAIKQKRAAETRLIRVQADKLDHLINLVGELVIAGASANLIARQSGQSALVEATSILSRLVENIRDAALQLRMVQIGDTFQRFHRVVRDVAKELNKEIELVINGAETELDKSVVEKIGDPLMHLVRNAIDHGIEPVAMRLARNKPAKGRVELNAYHDSGSIVIEVIDDGGGIDIEKVRTKAIEKGFITPGQTLSEQELLNLLFEPGFSTAEQVTNLSGRGVGLDVVKRNIQALRGTVEVKSELGRGSRFIVRLPLTLAIIDGFLTQVGNASYVVPLDNVVECLELKSEQTRGHVLNLRGEPLPFIRLRELFNISGQPPRRENVVVVTAAGTKVGIVVDRLLGEFQTVIKPLGTLFRHQRGIGGSTILGSGEVALILDVGALTHLASEREAHGLPSALPAYAH